MYPIDGLWEVRTMGVKRRQRGGPLMERDLKIPGGRQGRG